MERASLLNSMDTLINNDSDFGKFEVYLTNGASGVLYNDIATKTDFALTGTTNPSVAKGQAIIVCTRISAVPIGNQKIPVRYELSAPKGFAGAVNGSKIYIEVQRTLIEDPTLIEDNYPSNDYSLGIGIATMNMTSTYPGLNPYIKLWEYNGTSWTDMRTYPKVDGDKVDMSDLSQDINTSQNIQANRVRSNTAPSNGADLTRKDYVDSTIASTVAGIGASIPHSTNSSFGTSKIATDAIAKAGTDQEFTINAKQLIDEVQNRPGKVVAGTVYTASSYAGTKTITSGSMVEMLGGNIVRGGIYRVAHTNNSDSGTSCRTQIYVNGSPVGPETNTYRSTANPVTDITVNDGDRVSIYGRKSGGGDGRVSAYSIKYDMGFQYSFTTS